MKRIIKFLSGLKKKPEPEEKKVADVINPEDIKTVVDSRSGYRLRGVFRPIYLVYKRQYTTPNNETKNMTEVVAIKGEETND